MGRFNDEAVTLPQNTCPVVDRPQVDYRPNRPFADIASHSDRVGHIVSVRDGQ